MSRLDPEAIFIDHFGPNVEIGLCPICNISKIHRTNKTFVGVVKWYRSHIFPASMGGPDTYPNSIPLCQNCNSQMRNMDAVSYMMKIGKISSYQADSVRKNLIAKIRRWDPVCSRINKRSRSRCRNLKWGQFYGICRMHLKEQVTPMEVDK